MRLTGRVVKLEARLAAPGTGPDNPGAETVELWASLWIAAGLEESRAKAAALEFLLYCHMMGKAPTFGYGPGGLLRWCEGNIGGGEEHAGPGESLHEVLEQGHD